MSSLVYLHKNLANTSRFNPGQLVSPVTCQSNINVTSRSLNHFYKFQNKAELKAGRASRQGLTDHLAMMFDLFIES